MAETSCSDSFNEVLKNNKALQNLFSKKSKTGEELQTSLIKSGGISGTEYSTIMERKRKAQLILY